MTITAGTTSAVITVPVLDDLVIEPTDTVVVTLTTITSGDADISIDTGADDATIDILDDDVASLSIATAQNASETGPASGKFTVTQTAISSTDTVLSYSIAGSALGGTDYDPVKYIVATSPDGERVGSLEFGWHWHDNQPTPVKFRVFTQYLPMRAESAGVYTIGLYDSLEDTDSDVLFPLPVLKTNPLLQTRIP